jgi:hypothetical protein
MFSETEWAKNEVEKKGYNCGEKKDSTNQAESPSNSIYFPKTE